MVATAGEESVSQIAHMQRSGERRVRYAAA